MNKKTKTKKHSNGFSNSKNMAYFEAFHWCGDEGSFHQAWTSFFLKSAWSREQASFWRHHPSISDKPFLDRQKLRLKSNILFFQDKGSPYFRFRTTVLLACHGVWTMDWYNNSSSSNNSNLNKMVQAAQALPLQDQMAEDLVHQAVEQRLMAPSPPDPPSFKMGAYLPQMGLPPPACPQSTYFQQLPHTLILLQGPFYVVPRHLKEPPACV